MKQSLAPPPQPINFVFLRQIYGSFSYGSVNVNNSIET